jgi:hypothetical protein
MPTRQQTPTWQDVRRTLASKSKTELLNLMRDLYAQSPANKDFVNAQFLTLEETLEPCKAIVGALFAPAVTDSKVTMSQLSKVRQSRNRWKHKAIQRADDNRYLRKELSRIKHKRDRHHQALKANQVSLRLAVSCPDEKLLYLMIVDPSQSQAVRERETANITVAMEAWALAFSADSPENILSLYAEDSVLWGTLSPQRLDTPAAIRDYFAGMFLLRERKVTFTDPLIRVYGDTAVNTGYYTLSWIRNRKAEITPAHYSMTYVKRYQRWLIVEHHSSVVG